MRREEGDTVLLEVGLVGVEHAVEPGEELVGAVVGVEHDGDTVSGGDGADEVSGGDGTGDRALLLGRVGEALATEEVGATLRDLEDDGRLVVAGGLENGVDNRRRGNVLGALLEQVRDRGGPAAVATHNGLSDETR